MKYQNKTYKTNQALKDAHLNYPDIMPEGWKKYTLIKPRLDATLKDIPEGCKLLDIGCNSGEIALMFQEVKHCKVTGIDISKSLVKKAVSKGIDARVGDAEKLSFTDNTFDCVYMGEIIEHSYNPDVILDEAKRVLKPGGILVGNTINEQWFIEQGERIVSYHCDDERLHATVYRPHTMRQLLNRHFDNVSVYHLFYTAQIPEGPNVNSWIMFKGYK